MPKYALVFAAALGVSSLEFPQQSESTNPARVAFDWVISFHGSRFTLPDSSQRAADVEDAESRLRNVLAPSEPARPVRSVPGLASRRQTEVIKCDPKRPHPHGCRMDGAALMLILGHVSRDSLTGRLNVPVVIYFKDPVSAEKLRSYMVVLQLERQHGLWVVVGEPRFAHD